MLRSFLASLNRPAASLRRRSFLYGGLLFTVGATFMTGSWDGGDPGGFPAVEGARRSARTALRVLRPETPATARLLDRLIGDAEVVTADERTAPSWERVPGRVEAAWNRVLVTSHDALSQLRGRLRTQESRWRAMRDVVRDDVRQAQREANEAGVGRREISAAKQAALKWNLAERYASARAYERAVVEAQQAQSFTRIVRDGFVALHARYGDAKELRRWRSLVEQTIEQSRDSGQTVFIVDKLKRRLHVYDNGKRVASYRAELGAKGLKQKLHAGDQATPEGRYRISILRGPGRTKFYKALLIDYPNNEDRARYAWGVKAGLVPRRAGIGSLIEIHGDGGQGRDWTDGCVALDNRDMDAVFARATVGTPVTIVGTF
ncbi:MAG TPA: L,D-transpeptidase [Thermoanaerobaculia bacterium]|nr:L,D-transpeptidase [Thermoanaerobaculia bacterium]